MRVAGGFAVALFVAACGTPVLATDASLSVDARLSSDDAGRDAASTCVAPGAYADLSLDDVTYDLVVPPSARCDVPSALVVHLRGDAPDDGDSAALVASSALHSFVLVTPRLAGLDRDRLEAFLAALGQSIAIDPSRIDLVGRGAGAALAAQWLFGGTLAPRGIALVDYPATADTTPPLRTFAQRPRVWLSTGARATGFDAQTALLAGLRADGYDGYVLLVRERDSGPAGAPWLYPEIWSWLDHAGWPENGPPILPWQRMLFPAPDASMLSIDAMPDGTFVAGSADGRVFRTNESRKWQLVTEAGGGPLLGVVAHAGAPIFASTRALVRSSDGLAFARDPSLPSAGPILALADDAGTLYGVTSEGAIASSTDDGVRWAHLAQLARAEAIAVSALTHTVIAVGQGGAYVRIASGTPSSLPLAVRLHDVTAAADGTWWMVGSEGTVLRSTDDGLTFAPVVDPEGRHLDDLYCVSVGADGAMIAGGARGTVVVSHDGATLTTWPTSGQGFIGAVRWVEPGIAMILGQGIVALGAGL